MPKIKSIAKGLKAVAASLMKEEEEFIAAGIKISCSHCGNTKFEKRKYKLTTTICEGFWANDASVLICKKCARIEWFYGDV